jgi:hypothetical protein
MAKTKSSFFSLAAAGSIGQLTTAKNFRGGIGDHVMRMKPRAPINPRSSNQADCNNRFKVASDAWAILPQPDRDFWIQSAARFGKTARTLFIGEFLIQRCTVGQVPLQAWDYEGGAY